MQKTMKGSLLAVAAAALLAAVMCVAAPSAYAASVSSTTLAKPSGVSFQNVSEVYGTQESGYFWLNNYYEDGSMQNNLMTSTGKTVATIDQGSGEYGGVCNSMLYKKTGSSYKLYKLDGASADRIGSRTYNGVSISDDYGILVAYKKSGTTLTVYAYNTKTAKKIGSVSYTISGTWKAADVRVNDFGCNLWCVRNYETGLDKTIRVTTSGVSKKSYTRLESAYGIGKTKSGVVYWYSGCYRYRSADGTVTKLPLTSKKTIGYPACSTNGTFLVVTNQNCTETHYIKLSTGKEVTPKAVSGGTRSFYTLMANGSILVEYTKTSGAVRYQTLNAKGMYSTLRTLHDSFYVNGGIVGYYDNDSGKQVVYSQNLSKSVSFDGYVWGYDQTQGCYVVNKNGIQYSLNINTLAMSRLTKKCGSYTGVEKNAKTGLWVCKNSSGKYAIRTATGAKVTAFKYSYAFNLGGTNRVVAYNESTERCYILKLTA